MKEILEKMAVCGVKVLMDWDGQSQAKIIENNGYTITVQRQDKWNGDVLVLTYDEFADMLIHVETV